MATYTVTASQREANKKGTSGSSGSVGTSNSNSNSTVQYDPNTDYASLIQSAVQRGESQSVIDSLNAQRNAKISGMGLNQSALTADDIAGYKSGNTTATNTNVSGFNVNPTDDYIKGLAQSLQYDPNNPKGYADPEGYYTTRQTAFTWRQPDGTYKTTYSNATNQAQALKDAIAAGQVASGSSLAHASTYGTGSLTGNGYNYGAIAAGNGMSGFGSGSDGGRYTSDNQYGNMYDQTNMQLAFLSGRDGMDYQNPYAGLAYNGNGITNAYNKGTDFAGQGDIMGGYDFNFQLPDGTNLNDTAAKNNYNYELPTAQNGYIDPTTGAQSTYQDILDKYAEAISQQNASQAAQFKYEQDQANQGYDETQKANYINYMLAKKNIPASLQTQGVNGGMAESTRSALESDYMANYNATENARVNTSAQIDIAAQNALASNNMQAAEVYAGLAQSMLEYEQTAAYYRNQYNLSIMQMQQAQTQWEAEMAYQKAQDSYNATLQAQQMAAQEKQYAIEYAYQVQDWDTYGNLTGTDTSYMKQLSQAELESQLLANAKKNSNLNKNTNNNNYNNNNDDPKDEDDLKPWNGDGTNTVNANQTADPYAVLMAMKKGNFNNGKVLFKEA